MKKFIAQINGGDYINIPADEMNMDEDGIKVYCNGKLVAFLDVGIVLCAYLSGKE